MLLGRDIHVDKHVAILVSDTVEKMRVSRLYGVSSGGFPDGDAGNVTTLHDVTRQPRRPRVEAGKNIMDQ